MYFFHQRMARTEDRTFLWKTVERKWKLSTKIELVFNTAMNITKLRDQGVIDPQSQLLDGFSLTTGI